MTVWRQRRVWSWIWSGTSTFSWFKEAEWE